MAHPSEQLGSQLISWDTLQLTQRDALPLEERKLSSFFRAFFCLSFDTHFTVEPWFLHLEMGWMDSLSVAFRSHGGAPRHLSHIAMGRFQSHASMFTHPAGRIEPYRVISKGAPGECSLKELMVGN